MSEPLPDDAAPAAAPEYAARLRAVVVRAEPALRALNDDATRQARAPGAWSPREILGHLVDSASNNHQRFVRARSQNDLVFPGYEQDDWVAGQGYRDAPWDDLVTLWASFNRHLARVMAATPAAMRDREHRRHNLHEIATRPIAADAPATLGWFMADYVVHLEHHLRQILGDAWPAVPAVVPDRELAP